MIRCALTIGLVGLLWVTTAHAAQPSPENVESIEAQLRQEPHRLGLQLDLAIALCQIGEWERAQREFLLLDSRPDLPTGIADVIAWYRRTRACREPTGASWTDAQGFLAAGVGHYRNLNLGPSVDRVLLDGLQQVLELAETSRPRSAKGRQAEAGLNWDLGRWHGGLRQWSMAIYGQAQSFQGFSDLRLQGLNILAARKNRDEDGGQSDLLLGSSRLTLGDGTRLAAQTVQGVRMWPVSGTQSSGISVTMTWLDFAQRAALDARQTEVRGRWLLDGNTWQWGASLGWLDDSQIRGRPGGDRRGPFAVAQFNWARPSGLSVEGQWRVGLNQDAEPYAEALFGALQRRTHTQTAQFTLRQRLAPRWQLRLDARWTHSKDRLPLFTYQASSVAIWLEHALGSRDG